MYAYLGNSDSSPFLDLPGKPVTPTMSPRLVSLWVSWKADSSCSEFL